MRPRRPAPDRCNPHPGLCDADEAPSVLPANDPDAALAAEADSLQPYVRWADLMRAVHGIEVLDCPCGGKRRAVEQVVDKERIRATLPRLGLWHDPPVVSPPRRNPQAEFFDSAMDTWGVFKGRVTTRFEIGNDGTVVHVSVVRDDTPVQPLGCCVASRIQRWRFPRVTGPGSVIVNYPWVFTTSAK